MNLNKPFINVTSDTNGENGLAVLNLLNIGVFDLKFGKYVGGYLNKESFNFEKARENHEFYTHHPMFYLYPTYFLYKIFGISEATTRGGPMIMFILGIIFFFLALNKIFNNFWLPFLITLIFVIFPGTVYYGTTFELAVFSLPTALITFSLFVFYYFERKNIYLYSLIISIFLGGLMGWFYFFMPASIWFYLLFDKNPYFKNEKKLLIMLPLVSFFVFTLSIFHFYLLNGDYIFKDLLDAFSYRAQRLPLQFWIRDIYERMKLNFNPLFLWLAILGIFIYCSSYLKKYKILSPIILMPVLNTLVFYQWSTHPFGVIFFLPAVALGAGFLILTIMEKLKVYGVLIAIMILAFGFYLSYQKLDFFINKFLILGERDIQLLKELKFQIKEDKICLGQNQMGLYYGGIAMWYLRKNILFSPNCLENEKIKLAIVFNPQLGEFYQNETIAFLNKGFKPVGCADLWCLLIKQ